MGGGALRCVCGGKGGGAGRGGRRWGRAEHLKVRTCRGRSGHAREQPAARRDTRLVKRKPNAQAPGGVRRCRRERIRLGLVSPCRRCEEQVHLSRVDTPARELLARAPEQAGDIVARAELNLREGLALQRGLAHAHDEGVLRARNRGWAAPG